LNRIDFEVHFATQGWVDALTKNPGYPRLARDPVTGECLAFLEGRGLTDAEKEMLFEKNAAALGVEV
jgi:hypothetical protein